MARGVVRFPIMARKRGLSRKVARSVDPSRRTCLGCVFSYLMRSSPHNPVVSECVRSGERHVASTPHFEDCGFKERVGDAVIHGMRSADGR